MTTALKFGQFATKMRVGMSLKKSQILKTKSEYFEEKKEYF